jgi:signal peptidase II
MTSILKYKLERQRLTKQKLYRLCLPFILTFFILAADQLSKSYIVSNWPTDGGKSGYVVIKDVFNNGIVKIIHVRNTVIAFSLGTGIPEDFRTILFVGVPILVLLTLLGSYFLSSEWTQTQRWALAGIFGGGAGNLIDRVRPSGGVPGVVDFVSVKCWGLFGFERWPTFNVADATVVVCVFIMLFSFLIPDKKKGRRA